MINLKRQTLNSLYINKNRYLRLVDKIIYGAELMRINLVIILFVLASCSGPKDSNPKVTAGDLSDQQESKVFIKNSHSEIPSSLQIQAFEVDNWEQEGLLTQEEAAIIQETL